MNVCLAVPQESHPPLIILDTKPEFEICAYSYDGGEDRGTVPLGSEFVRLKTEFWGETFFKLCTLLPAKFPRVEFFSFINGDVMFSVSDYNKMFRVADLIGAKWFQPSLSRDSHFSFAWTLNQPGSWYRQVAWCEIMAFTLTRNLVEAIARQGVYSISGWGMDKHLIPRIFKLEYPESPAYIFDCISVRHMKPIQSVNLRFSNGLTAKEELEIMAAFMPSTL